jgi:hypothetical protein
MEARATKAIAVRAMLLLALEIIGAFRACPIINCAGCRLKMQALCQAGLPRRPEAHSAFPPPSITLPRAGARGCALRRSLTPAPNGALASAAAGLFPHCLRSSHRSGPTRMRQRGAPHFHRGGFPRPGRASLFDSKKTRSIAAQDLLF